MTFNQTVWDALTYAAGNAYQLNMAAMVQALEEYAAACDGTAKLTYAWGRVRSASFIPNPIQTY